VIDLNRACSRHRPILIDFVDRGEIRPATGAALAHLERCPRCTEVVEGTVLTITALRRIGDDAARVEPPDDAWPRLRDRIRQWQRRPAMMSPIAGVAMSFALVAVLVLPIRFAGSGLVDSTIAPTFTTDTSVSPAERLIETAYVANSRRLPASVQSVGSLILNLPAEIREVRKEVHSAKPSGRSPEPI
jgi:anti-sigma factor RsiW